MMFISGKKKKLAANYSSSDIAPSTMIHYYIQIMNIIRMMMTSSHVNIQ